jgi:acyl-coenzyme A thioesterase PaaI-like protein
VSSLAGGGPPVSFPDDHPDTARLRLAEALRPLITMTVTGTPDDDALESVADAVERLVAQLAAGAGTDRRMRQPPDAGRPTIEYFPTSPIAGILNPIAPPIHLVVVDGEDGGPSEIQATAWFDYPYEGPPSCVHGGVIAATFDEILGAAIMVSGNPGMTGTLSVRYRKPTPLRTDLRLEARFLGRDGRKIRTWAGMYHGDVLTAEADGLFIEVMPRQMLAIAEQNASGPDDGLLAAMRRGVDAFEAHADPATPAGD